MGAASQQAEDRRRAPRFSFSAPVALHARGRALRGRIRDISRCGAKVRLETSAMLIRGEDLRCRFEIPGRGLIEVYAEVRWISGSAMVGLQFLTPLSASELRDLERSAKP